MTTSTYWRQSWSSVLVSGEPDFHSRYPACFYRLDIVGDKATLFFNCGKTHGEIVHFIFEQKRNIWIAFPDEDRTDVKYRRMVVLNVDRMPSVIEYEIFSKHGDDEKDIIVKIGFVAVSHADYEGELQRP